MCNWWPQKSSHHTGSDTFLIQIYSVLSILPVHISLQIIKHWCFYLSFIYRHKIYFNMVFQSWCFAKCNVHVSVGPAMINYLHLLLFFSSFVLDTFNLINAFMSCSSPSSLSPGQSFLHVPILLQLTLVLAFSLLYTYSFSFL